MFWFELLIAVIISLALAALFVPLLGWRRPGSSSDEGALMPFLFFFFIVFLAALAGGVWIRPIGPQAWGVAWLSYLMIALVVALVLAAVTPPRRRRVDRTSPVDPGPAPRSGNGEAMIAAGLGSFFWILMLLLLFVTAAAYAFEPDAWSVSESTVYPPGAP